MVKAGLVQDRISSMPRLLYLSCVVTLCRLLGFRTGFEETKDFPIEINGVIAGRYQVPS